VNRPYMNAGSSFGGIPKTEDGRHPVPGGYVHIRGGVKHRDRGPAEVLDNGYKAWWRHGKRDRKGAPAIIHPDGTFEWWEDGKFIRKMEANPTPPGTKLFKGRRIK
jgi:hypothetical protein